MNWRTISHRLPPTRALKVFYISITVTHFHCAKTFTSAWKDLNSLPPQTSPYFCFSKYSAKVTFSRKSFQCFPPPPPNRAVHFFQIVGSRHHGSSTLHLCPRCAALHLKTLDAPSIFTHTHLPAHGKTLAQAIPPACLAGSDALSTTTYFRPSLPTRLQGTGFSGWLTRLPWRIHAR